MTDEQIIKDIIHGVLQNGMILFNRYEKKVFSFYRYMGLSTEDSEDLTHEVFENVFRHCKSFKTNKIFKPWLYQIMRNKLVDFRRQHGKISYSDIGEYDFKDSVESVYDEADFKRLNLALLKLEEHDRELMLLVKFQQLSYYEVAQIFNISEGAVKTRVHRIIKKLTEIYKQYSYEKN